MIELTVAKNVLQKILFDHIDFKTALKSEISGKKRTGESELRTNVSHLIVTELRHHVLFKTLIEKTGYKYNTDDLAYIYLLFTVKFFDNHLDYEKVNKEVKTFLKKEKYTPLVEIISSNDPYTLLDFKQKSMKYVACRYNIQPWILELWSSQYGSSFATKMAQALAKPRELTYRVNTLYSDYEKVLKENADLLIPCETSNLVKAKQSDLIKAKMPKDFLFVEDANIKNLVDKYENDFLNELTIYSGSDDVLPIELLVRSKLQTGINVACPFFEEKAGLLRFMRSMSAHNMNVFAAHDVIKLRTGISRDTEIVYCNPKSSSFGKINSQPDYLVHLRMSELPKFIKMQKEAIENCSHFVCHEGILIYLVDTFNKNETINVVAGFLHQHPEFTIIEEEQLYPQTSNGSSLYYAVLKLEKTND